MAVNTYFAVGGRSKRMRKGSKVSVNGHARKLHKLYASVGGTSKLIFDDGDAQPAGKYILYYQEDASYPIQTMAVNSLTTGQSGMSITTLKLVNVYKPGTTELMPASWVRGIRIGSELTRVEGLQHLNQNLIMPLYIPDNVTEWGNILQGSKYNLPIFFGRGLTVINGPVMRESKEFNSPIYFGGDVTKLTTYGFLMDAWSFNQDITIPQTVTQIGDPAYPGATIGIAFLRNAKAMTSTVDFGNLMPSIFDPSGRFDCFATNDYNAPMYTEGIKVKVAPENLSYWAAAFPNVDTGTWRRKIIWIVD